MARRPKPPPIENGQLTEHRTGLAHVVELIRHTVPPMHPAGYPFVAAAGAIALAGRRRRAIAGPAAAAGLAFGAFFRHPPRVPSTLTGAVVAAADGEVALVDTQAPPPELGLDRIALPRISTFLSVFDVHVQRVPISGVVEKIVHTPGTFLSADLPEASRSNERTSMILRTPSGHRIVVVQIAGLLARRIVNEANVGDQLEIGDTYGLIKFGSRVDVYLPAGTEPLVGVGQRTVGAETVLARLP